MRGLLCAFAFAILSPATALASVNDVPQFSAEMLLTAGEPDVLGRDGCRANRDHRVLVQVSKGEVERRVVHGVVGRDVVGDDTAHDQSDLSSVLSRPYRASEIITTDADRLSSFRLGELAKGLIGEQDAPRENTLKFVALLLMQRVGVFVWPPRYRRSQHPNLTADVQGGGLPDVFERNANNGRDGYLLAVNIEKVYSSDIDALNLDPRSIAGSERSSSDIDAGLGVLGGIPSALGSNDSGDERGKARDEPRKANVKREPCPTGGVSRGVCGLPLSAKVGLTIVLTGLAWLLFVVSLVRALDKRRYALSAAGGLIGVSLALLPLTLWW